MNVSVTVNHEKESHLHENVHYRQRQQHHRVSDAGPRRSSRGYRLPTLYQPEATGGTGLRLAGAALMISSSEWHCSCVRFRQSLLTLMHSFFLSIIRQELNWSHSHSQTK